MIPKLYLLHIGVLDSMSQTHTFGSSSPPAEATKRSLGEMPTAATDARCSKCCPIAVKEFVSQMITCTYKMHVVWNKKLEKSTFKKTLYLSLISKYNKETLTFEPIRWVSPVAKYFPELLSARHPIGWVCPVRNSWPPPAVICRTVILDPKG